MTNSTNGRLEKTLEEDPVGHYHKYYPSVPLNDLKERNPELYGILIERELTSSIILAHEQYEGNPFSFYQQHFDGLTSSALLRIRPKLHALLRDRGLLDKLPQEEIGTSFLEEGMPLVLINRFTEGSILGVTKEEFTGLFGGDMLTVHSFAKQAGALLGEKYVLDGTFLRNLLVDGIIDRGRTGEYLTLLGEIEDPNIREVRPYLHPTIPIKELMSLRRFGSRASSLAEGVSSWRSKYTEPAITDFQRFIGFQLEERTGKDLYPCSKELFGGFGDFWNHQTRIND